MTKTLVELDDDLLTAAMRELGTKTKKDTVNEALRFAATRGERARANLASFWGQDITDPEIMKGARR